MTSSFISTSYSPDLILDSGTKTSTFYKGISKARITIFDTPLEDCPNPKMKKEIDFDTGEIIEEVQDRWEETLGKYIPVRCGNNSCRPCAHLNAKKIAGAIYVSEPSHTFTMTLVPDNSKAIAKQVIKVFESARKEIPTLKYVWSAETNPGDTGSHVHGFVHAEKHYFSQINKTLTSSIGKVTHGNRCEVSPVPKYAGISYYAYPMKSVLDQEQFDIALELNGPPGRRALVHASKEGFWRNGVNGPNHRRAKLELIAKKKMYFKKRER